MSLVTSTPTKYFLHCGHRGPAKLAAPGRSVRRPTRLGEKVLFSGRVKMEGQLKNAAPIPPVADCKVFNHGPDSFAAVRGDGNAQ